MLSGWEYGFLDANLSCSQKQELVLPILCRELTDHLWDNVSCRGRVQMSLQMLGVKAAFRWTC